jgi:hypothetical protein
MQTGTAIDKLNKLAVLIMLGMGIIIHVYWVSDIYTKAFLDLVYGNDHVADCQNGTLTKRIIMKIDLVKEKQLQTEVDKGHQPWRLEPVNVAYAAVASIDNNVKHKKCQLATETDYEAFVSCKNVKIYLVRLKKLTRIKNGIWTATDIQIKE